MMMGPMTQLRMSDTPNCSHAWATLPSFLVLDLGEHGVHHPEQADRNRERHRADREGVEQVLDARGDGAENHAQRHRRKDPQGQKAVEQRKLLENADLRL